MPRWGLVEQISRRHRTDPPADQSRHHKARHVAWRDLRKTVRVAPRDGDRGISEAGRRGEPTPVWRTEFPSRAAGRAASSRRELVDIRPAAIFLGSFFSLASGRGADFRLKAPTSITTQSSGPVGHKIQIKTGVSIDCIGKFISSAATERPKFVVSAKLIIL